MYMSPRHVHQRLYLGADPTFFPRTPLHVPNNSFDSIMNVEAKMFDIWSILACLRILTPPVKFKAIDSNDYGD